MLRNIVNNICSKCKKGFIDMRKFLKLKHNALTQFYFKLSEFKNLKTKKNIR